MEQSGSEHAFKFITMALAMLSDIDLGHKGVVYPLFLSLSP